MWRSWLPLVIAVFLAVIVGPALREGMFYDGLIYASIARNMYEGVGSFWLPHFTITDDNVFHSHPPLAFWLESLPFYLTGDSIYAERIYELVITALHAVLIGFFWYLLLQKQAENSDKLAVKSVFLPLLLWLFVPIVEWGAANNLLENTMTLWATAAVVCVFLFLRRRFNYWYLSASALFILFAFGSKGVTGLFPLSSIFLYYCCFRKTENAISLRQMIGYSGLLSLFFWLFFGAILLFIPNAYTYLTDYLKVQVVNSVANVKTVSSHWSIIFLTLNQLSTILIIVALVGFGVYYRNIKQQFIPKLRLVTPEVYWAFLVALSAVLPIMISQKQSNFYALGCYPFFSLSAALWLLPAFLYGQKKLEATKFWQFMPIINSILVSISVAVVFFFLGKTRNQEQAGIADVAILSKKVPVSEVIGACYDVRSDWTFSCYAMRYQHLEIDINPDKIHNFYLLAARSGDFPAGITYEEVPNLGLKTVRLYRKTAEQVLTK
jgi:4-amino-4-deoxy-L-arabinose transferase-like glycosyltransferase